METLVKSETFSQVVVSMLSKTDRQGQAWVIVRAAYTADGHVYASRRYRKSNPAAVAEAEAAYATICENNRRVDSYKV